MAISKDGSENTVEVKRTENDFIVLTDKDTDKTLFVSVNSLKYVNSVYNNVIDKDIKELVFFKDGISSADTNINLQEQLEDEKDKIKVLEYQSDLLNTDIDVLLSQASSSSEQIDVLQQDKINLSDELFRTYENMKPDVGTFIQRIANQTTYIVLENEVTKVKEKRKIPNLYTFVVEAWYRKLEIKENDPLRSEFIQVLESSEFDFIPYGIEYRNDAPMPEEFDHGTILVNKLNNLERYLIYYSQRSNTKAYKIVSNDAYNALFEFFETTPKQYYDGYLSKVQISSQTITTENVFQFMQTGTSGTGGTAGTAGTGGGGGTAGTGGGGGSTPMVVDFNWSPLIPIIEETVDFNGYASGGSYPYQYSWYFPSGAEPTNATGQNVSVTFGHKGKYSVKLTVTDNVGNSEEKIENVYVKMS
jgi:hypothetical protein